MQKSPILRTVILFGPCISIQGPCIEILLWERSVAIKTIFSICVAAFLLCSFLPSPGEEGGKRTEQVNVGKMCKDKA